MFDNVSKLQASMQRRAKKIEKKEARKVCKNVSKQAKLEKKSDKLQRKIARKDRDLAAKKRLARNESLAAGKVVRNIAKLFE